MFGGVFVARETVFPVPAGEELAAVPAPAVVRPDPDDARDQGERPAQDITLPAPQIDEFRLEPDGVTVVAGRSVPGDLIVLRLDGTELTSARTEASGVFATIAFIDPSETARVLTLAAVGADGVERVSPDELILAPSVVAAPVSEPAPIPVAGILAPEVVADGEATRGASASEDEPLQTSAAQDRAAEPDAPAVIATSGGKLAAASPQPVAETAQVDAQAKLSETDLVAAAQIVTQGATTQRASVQSETPKPEADMSASEPASGPTLQANVPHAVGAPEGLATSVQIGDQPATQTAKPAAPSLVTILRSSPEGVEVVQAPGTRPVVQRRVELDAISYSATGDVQLSGRAERRAAEVRIYLDNRPIAAIAVDKSGDWRGDVPDIASGIYTLRIDSVDEAGTVQSRVETPFKREPPELLLAAVAQSNTPMQAITVQKGATLWAIARERYGDPFLYVQVFEANRTQIRDPDLIYPGQVFTLPEGDGE